MGKCVRNSGLAYQKIDGWTSFVRAVRGLSYERSRTNKEKEEEVREEIRLFISGSRNQEHWAVVTIPSSTRKNTIELGRTLKIRSGKIARSTRFYQLWPRFPSPFWEVATATQILDFAAISTWNIAYVRDRLVMRRLYVRNSVSYDVSSAVQDE